MRLAATIILIVVSSASSEDFYVCHFGNGTQSGADTNNCHNMEWFNTSANWGSGAGKISAGDTVYLFGLFTTNSANCSLLQSPASTSANGTAGSPIAIRGFYPNTVLEGGQFHINLGALSIGDSGEAVKRHDFVISDLVIRNTNNGSVASGLGVHALSTGLYIASGLNIEVTNCIITNIYYMTGVASNDLTAFSACQCIFFNHSATNVSVHDCYLADAHIGINGSPGGTPFETIHMYRNVLTNCCWGMQFAFGPSTTPGPTAPNTWINGLLIESNDFRNWDIWSTPPAPGSAPTAGIGIYHTDGIILYGNVTNEESWVNAPIIRNNYFHGLMFRGGNTILTSLGCSTRNALVYNNIYEMDDTNTPAYWINSSYNCRLGGNNGKCPTNNSFFNNTIYGTDNHPTKSTFISDYAINIGGTNEYVTNNIIHNFNSAFLMYDVVPLADYNLYGSVNFPMLGSNGIATNFSAWIAAGQDTHSITNQPPLLNPSTFVPYANSSARNAGANLTGLGITNDYAGNARAVPFDIGALEFQDSGPPPLPTNGTSVTLLTFLQRRVDSITQTFYITNKGTDSLVGTASVSTAYFTLSGGTNYSLTPGQTSIIAVAFGPQSAGTYSDTVTCTGGGNAGVFLYATATNFPTVGIAGKVSVPSGKVRFQ